MSTSPSSQSSQPMNQAIPTARVPTGGLVSPDRASVRHALTSVYDKTGLLPFARALAGTGIGIVSIGSTVVTIATAGLAVTPVEGVAGFPECLGERVRTPHPAVHVGILADCRKPDHLNQLATLGVTPIDLIVVNLYPFTDAVASGVSLDACVEQIDIGGPMMVHTAAKNHPAIAVVTNLGRCGDITAAIREGGFTLPDHRHPAAEAFAHTAAHDAAMSTWMAAQTEAGATSRAIDPTDVVEVETDGSAAPPAYVGVGYERLASLRYRENPRQRTAVYHIAGASRGVAGARQLHGKAMSYNNYADADAAMHTTHDHDPAVTVTVVKRTNPCDITVLATDDATEVHRKTYTYDPVSTCDGVITTSAVVTAEMAHQIEPIFTEIVAAPAFDDEAVEILSAKKNLRLLLVEVPQCEDYEIKQVPGGAVIQGRGVLDTADGSPLTWALTADPVADDALLAGLAFAWRSVRVAHSNAVPLVHGGATVGVGMGQVNHADSCKLTVERANALGARSTGDAALDGSRQEKRIAGGVGAADVLAGTAVPQRARRAVIASDAFFPSADGFQVLIDAGVRVVVRPSGSIRDQKIIDAAQVAGVTMYFVDTHHFSH